MKPPEGVDETSMAMAPTDGSYEVVWGIHYRTDDVVQTYGQLRASTVKMVAEEVEEWSGGDHDYHKQSLDIYMPSGRGEGRPVVVHVHGGGWVRGDRGIEFYGAPYMCSSAAVRGRSKLIP